MKGKVEFKRYDQRLTCLLPPGYEERLPTGYHLRVVDEIIERIDITDGMEKRSL